jgi:hypothetical protein
MWQLHDSSASESIAPPFLSCHILFLFTIYTYFLVSFSASDFVSVSTVHSLLQVLMMRIHDDLFEHLRKFPRRLLVPHRLNPYPEAVRALLTTDVASSS